jgi:AAA15 family ATPase/GTPase
MNLSLSPNLNLLTGENDVGKSTLVKSFYHCLGADTPQINNTVWRRANPIYCVNFEIGGDEYHIVRDEKYFGVF